MSIFAPIDPRFANDRRKRLAMRLQQQAAASGGHPALGVARIFRGALGMGRSPFSSLTFDSALPPGLADKLGPGGFGHPTMGQFSSAPGMPVQPPVPPIQPPQPPGPPPGSGGGGGGSPAPPPSGSMGSVSQVGATNPPAASTVQAGTAGSGFDPTATTVSTNNIIPLGNGVFIDPISGQVFGGGLGHGAVI